MLSVVFFSAKITKIGIKLFLCVYNIDLKCTDTRQMCKSPPPPSPQKRKDKLKTMEMEIF